MKEVATIRRHIVRLGTGALGLLLSGCGDIHTNESALNPAGQQAHRIGSLTWLFISVCVVVYVAMAMVLGAAVVRRREGQAADAGMSCEPITEPDAAGEKKAWSVVSGAILLTVVTLFVLLIADFITGRAIHTLGNDPDPLRVQLTGNQWWWKVDYTSWPSRFGAREPSNQVTSANEIHVPVDPANPVTLEVDLKSEDVIHSFWVPSLHGKMDLVPGHPAATWLRVDKPGVYWGECAEYCGYQHAQMRIAIVAEPPEQFQNWLDSQRKPAPAPSNAAQARGREVLLAGTCAFCHTVQGTTARGHLGPDLTHVASRQALAAGAVANKPGYLAGWIVDPQKIKPGCRMPQNNLAPDDLRSLLEYMETLK